MFTRTLFCIENSFAIISQTYENIVGAKNDKAKIRLLQILGLHFIAATIEKQQDLGDN
jgi:hypothetical protein